MTDPAPGVTTERPRILLADDNSATRRNAERALSSNYTVEFASDGAAALTAIRRRHPTVVLSAARTPRLDGLGLLRAIRADPQLRAIPFVLLRARADADDSNDGGDGGADECLFKPFSAAELATVVRCQVKMAQLRIQVAQQLSDSAARFRAVSNAAPIVVWTASPDGGITYVSDEWYAYAGKRRDDRGTWADVVHPDDRERCVAAWRAHLVAGVRFEIEARMRRHDGVYRWFMGCTMPLRDDTGRIVEWVGTATDTHDFRLASERLSENEQLLQLAQESAEMGVWSHELSTGIVHGSPLAFALFDLETVPRAHPISALRARIHPADRLHVEQAVESASRDNMTYRTEFRIRRRDGSERWLAARGRVVRDKLGRALRITGVNYDITERRRAEAERERLQDFLAAERAKLDTVIQNLPVGAGLFDRAGHVLAKNRELDRYLVGSSGPSALLPHALRWRVSPDGPPIEPAEFPGARTLRGEFVKGEEFLFRTSGGEERWTKVSTVPIVDCQGEVTAGLAVVIDIDDQKRALDRQHLLIQELNHRVKNTLATVQSIASFTLGRSSSERQSFAAFEARLIALSRTHDVLTLENWENAELSAIVSSATSPFTVAGAGRIAANGPSVRLKPKSALAIAMALHELATNAAKFGALSKPEGCVTVDWSVSEAGGESNLRLRWEECGGPAVEPPERKGFGSRLLERGLALDLGGTVDLSFARSGVVAAVVAPLGAMTA